MLEISLILTCAALVWLWIDSLHAREAAVAAARHACAVEGFMLLDDTVAIAALKLARNDEGRIQIQRAYNFEYSDTGNNRRNGSVVLLGRRVVVFNIG
jgi:hypothetical protein